MKRIMFLALMAITLLAVKPANAQVSVSVNIGVQPIWGPTGYDHVDYYYLPDIDGYYDVNSRVFVFLENGVWVRTANLPPRYANFDLYHAYKVVLNERDPWLHHEQIRTKYAIYKGHRDQAVIRDSHEHKYYENKDHPRHNEWHGPDKHDEHHDRH